MIIINQDRDAVYTYNNGSVLMSAPALRNGTLYGFNLYIDETALLGTFDSVQEIITELQRIMNAFNDKTIIYQIMGYEKEK